MRRQVRRAVAAAVAAWACAAGLSGVWAAPQSSVVESVQTCPPPPVVPSADALQAQRRDAPDRGFLWRISRDGRSSWLYGTLHVGRAEWLVQGPQVRQALRASDVIALELDLRDPATRQVLSQASAATARGPGLTPARQAALAREMAQACLPVQALSVLPPAMQAATLLAGAGRADGYYPDFGVDLVLAGLPKPLVGLERAEDQVAALSGRNPAETDAMIDQQLKSLASGQARGDVSRLASIWNTGDLDGLQRYLRQHDASSSPAERAWTRRLLDDRNPSLARSIERLHAGGQRVFAAVGAAHMAGPHGVPALLAARGFTVERIVFAAPARAALNPGSPSP
ncbi:MAG: hypothetical protein GAK30_02420 [Paracidovorax wautersii]|uniref:TraB family protein n=1 Tax=Paracidovorax wautersii TaxID=1177982 RepID=A0A7V8FN28_9BURK|nr:MAG: hypothetical protein GAK30_02420 [Paracidovorax wautersii]